MKKLSILILIILFAVGYNFAQERERGGGERPSKEAGKGGSGGRQQMNPEEMLKRQNQRLVDELSADQLKLFDEMQKKNAEAMKNRQGGNWGSQPSGQGQ